MVSQTLAKRKSFYVLFFVTCLLTTSCGDGSNVSPSSLESAKADSSSMVSSSASDGRTTVLYFSCTSNTKGIADKISANLGCLELRIVPKEVYTSADLNYNDANCRANREQSDPAARPAIANAIDVTPRSTFFLGYPIWWGTLPRIIETLCDTYDFSGCTIVPFCTSGSSGIETSVTALKSLEPEAVVFPGRRFASSSTQADVDAWLASLNLPKAIL
jgi:flavodoxin